MPRSRVKPLRSRIELFEVNINVLSHASWHESYNTPCGKTVDALATLEEPREVVDLLDSYGIHDVDWYILGDYYLYW